MAAILMEETIPLFLKAEVRTVCFSISIDRSIADYVKFVVFVAQVNHSVTDEYLGAVNGLGQSLAALARSVGPALGGVLWSLSTTHHFVYLNFIAVVVVLGASLYISSLMPASLDFKKVDKRQRRGRRRSRSRSRSRSGSGSGGSGGAAAPMMH
jgi:uncharacterized membrane protein YgcG